MRWTKNYKELSIDLINEWWGVFSPKKFNWVDFHLIDIHVEWDRVHGVFEKELIIFGFGVRFYWIYNSKANEESINKYLSTLESDSWVELK